MRSGGAKLECIVRVAGRYVRRGGARWINEFIAWSALQTPPICGGQIFQERGSTTNSASITEPKSFRSLIQLETLDQWPYSLSVCNFSHKVGGEECTEKNKKTAGNPLEGYSSLTRVRNSAEGPPCSRYSASCQVRPVALRLPRAYVPSNHRGQDPTNE